MSVAASLPLTLALEVAVGVDRPFLLYYWAFESHKSACQKRDHLTTHFQNFWCRNRIDDRVNAQSVATLRTLDGFGAETCN
jgi:hypothetical protein